MKHGKKKKKEEQKCEQIPNSFWSEWLNIKPNFLFWKVSYWNISHDPIKGILLGKKMIKNIQTDLGLLITERERI
jgi:hypothetical protein